MRYKQYILASIFFLLSGLSFGQVPGYMGKKVHLQFGIKFFPSFVKPVNLMQEAPIPFIVPGMNYRLELGADFVVSRKSSVGVNLHYYNTAMSPIYGLYPSVTGDYRLALEGGSIGFVFKTHFGGWVAPLGFYYRLEVGAMIFSGSDIANNYGGIVSPFVSGTGYINNALGRTHIFANIISLDYGAEVGFAFPPYDGYNSSTVESVANSRMAFHNLVNVYVKTGVVF